MDDHERLVRTLRRIEVAYGDSGWHGDEFVAPALFSLHEEGRSSLTAVRFRMPNVAWRQAPVGPTLQHFARSLADVPELLEPFRAPGWRGLALAAETWAVTGLYDDPERYASIMADAESRLVHLRPDRVNARFAMGITRDQDRAFLTRIEGEDVEIMDGAFPGGVAHGLSAMVGAIDELVTEET